MTSKLLAVALSVSLVAANPGHALSLEDVFKSVTKPFTDVATAATGVATQILGGAGQVLEGGVGVVEQVGSGTFTIVNKGGEVVGQIAQTVGGTTVVTIGSIGTNVTTAVSSAGTDVVATYTKAWRDTGEQARRSFDDTVEAGAAALRYSERTIASGATALSNAERRAREGKLIDAVWGLALEPAQAQEDNFFKATQESSVINQAAGSAAAIYGGPGGAAAYAAWATYKATGDATAAFKVGLAAALTSAVGPGEALPADSSYLEVVKRAAVAGATGGVSVAAQGGDEAAITNAFLKSSGAVLIQAGQGQAKAYSPKAAEALKLAECVSAKDVDCLSNTTYVRDASGRMFHELGGAKVAPGKLDVKQEIGKWSGIDLNAAQSKVDKAIADVSKLPGSQKIVLFGGRFVLTSQLGQYSTVGYGKPVVVLTAVGKDSPFNFSRTFGKIGPALAGGNYNCIIGMQPRTIRSVVSGTSCRTVYRRHDGTQQVIWETPSHPAACVPKAQAFVNELARKGITCSPR
jgi:hypothetical protein